MQATTNKYDLSQALLRFPSSSGRWAAQYLDLAFCQVAAYTVAHIAACGRHGQSVVKNLSPNMSRKVSGPEIEHVVQLLARMPGLGPRSARKAALALLKKRNELLLPLSHYSAALAISGILDAAHEFMEEKFAQPVEKARPPW